MNTGFMPLVENVNYSANSFTPLEGGFDIVVRQMPAARIAFSRTVTMYGSEPVLFFTQSGPLRPDYTSRPTVDLDSISIPCMLDWSDAGNQEVTLITPEPIECSEIFIGEPLPAFMPEFS